MSKAYFKSPIGILEIVSDGKGVCELNFVKSAEKVEANDEILRLALRELEAYFAGKLKKFSVPLSFKASKFQSAIYEVLCDISYGETITYKELAARAGSAKACRAAGSANAKNPIPIIIPCHRVVASKGLGGYSGGDGLATKIWLLKHENADKI